MQLEHDELDAPGIDALDLLEQIVEHRRQRPIRSVIIGLAPAGDPFIGLDLHQQPRPVADALHECP